MPRVLSYTPSWLSRPSPGFDLFVSTKDSSSTPKTSRKQANGTNKREEYLGPRRTIARRGTEVFVVVDNQIRWSDLSIFKDDWESLRKKEGKQTQENPEVGQSYRILDIPVSERIRQLTISPNGQFLAIATSHTVRVAILPSPSVFDENKGQPIKPKTHTLGPTTHVLSQPPVVSLLWHPCSADGSCLITVTAEAAVRLWELDRTNRWSFNEPSFALDLRKLQDAVSQEDNVAPRRVNESKGFSADAGDMEIVSACFGGTGSPDESAWSAMTLWTVTNEGDVYALCPLLPSKWQPTSTQLPSLSAAAVTRTAAQISDGAVPEEADPSQKDQYDWLSEIDAQVPLLITREGNVAVNDALYSRPKYPGPVPRLQGPFQLAAGSVIDFQDVSDIYVIPPKMDTEELMLGEDDASEQGLQEETDGVSATVICFLTTDGRVYLFLDLEGVEGSWLPAKAPKQPLPTPEAPELILLEALETLDPADAADDEWPTFSRDPFSRYSIFTTHSQGVHFFSLSPWITRLEEELQNSSTAGTDFRLKVLRETMGTLKERIIHLDQDRFYNMEDEASPSATACIALYDSDLGYFLLTATENNNHPHAASLDVPKSVLMKSEAAFDDFDTPFAYPEDPSSTLFTTHIARSAYEPAGAFWNGSSLLSLTDKTVAAHRRHTLQQEIRLSSTTLDVMTNAHRLISGETQVIRMAAADLFNRCERMMKELEEQITRVRETLSLAEDLEQGDQGEKEGGGQKGNGRLDDRVQRAKDRQESLSERMKLLRRKVGKLGGRELSDREKEYIRELEQLERALEKREDDEDKAESPRRRKGSAEPYWQRYDEVRGLSQELVQKAKKMGAKRGDEQKKVERDEWSIPNEVRRKKVEQVQEMLERESALVDAVQARLEKLKVGGMI
ncbi:MAG: hypothetical protein LQ350_002141 [Teloschistes chrysophthalmus]|nr:MAG: hypothetical protein LQ350_002141 [Niorma chrysophthalma]